MRAETSLERAIREYEKDPDFVLEGMLWDLNDQIARAMKNQKISRAELARRLHTSRGYVTKLLRGTTNVTMQSLARLAIALESDVNIKLSAAQRPVEVSIRTAAVSPHIPHLKVWGSQIGRGEDGGNEGRLIRFFPTSSAGTDFHRDQAEYA